MPLVINLADFRRSIEVKQQALSDRAIQEKLQAVGNEYIANLRAIIRQRVDQSRSTGTMESALVTYMGMWQTPGGGWAIGIGDMARLGLPSDQPPRGTIRAFLEWYHAAAEAEVPEVMAVEREVLKEQAARLAARRAKVEAAQLEKARKPRPRKKPAWEATRAKQIADARRLEQQVETDRQARQRRLDFLREHARQRGYEITEKPTVELTPQEIARAGRRAQAATIRTQLQGLQAKIANLERQRDAYIRSVAGTPLADTARNVWNRRIDAARQRAEGMRRTLRLLQER